MNATSFQKYVQQQIKSRENQTLILVAPTGLGKTFAVTGDLQEEFRKTVYAVPLRALGNDIKRSIGKYERKGTKIEPVVHHGAVKESMLFGEEVIVTTYDQVVCGVPGLPLSLPLKAGHAVAGALLMSRLIFDEAHLAWGISDQALSILFAIVSFRQKMGLQTILLTATLPDKISELLERRLGAKKIVVGERGEVSEDEGLTLRNENRCVTIECLKLGKLNRGNKELDFRPLDTLLTAGPNKSIYFSNTVERIQNRILAIFTHEILT